MALAPVGIGAGQEHEGVGPSGEGGPRLHAVDSVAAVGGGGRDLEVGDVGAVVGLGHHHADHGLAGGDLREPDLLLFLGAAPHQGPGEDLGPGDERAAHAEAAPGQLLGGDDHAEVVALAAGGEPAVLLGHRQAEAADLGQAADDLLGDVEVLAVDLLGHRADLVGGEAVEGVADELELLGQVGGPAAVAGHLLGDVLGELRRTVGGDELAGRGELGGAHPPLRLPSHQPGHEVGDGLGGEQAGQPGLEPAVGAVVEHDRRPSPRRR